MTCFWLVGVLVRFFITGLAGFGGFGFFGGTFGWVGAGGSFGGVEVGCRSSEDVLGVVVEYADTGVRQDILLLRYFQHRLFKQITKTTITHTHATNIIF